MIYFLQSKKVYIIGVIILTLIIIFLYFKIAPLSIDKFFKRERIETFIDAEDVVLVLYKDGKKHWQIKAKKIKLSKDKRITDLIDIIEGIFFSKDDKKYYFKADYASYNSLTKNLDIIGKIVITDNKELKINLDRLKYTHPNMLESFGKVIVFFKNNYINGDKLLANFDKNELELIGNIEGKIYVEEEKKI